MNRFDEMEKGARERYEADVLAAKKKLERVLSAISVLREEIPEDTESFQEQPRLIRRTIPPRGMQIDPFNPAANGMSFPDGSHGMAPAPTKAYGEITEIVRKSFPYVPKVFDHTDVSGVISKKWSDTQMESRSVREALRRLEDAGDIEVAIKGEGRRPTKYINPTITE